MMMRRSSIAIISQTARSQWRYNILRQMSSQDVRENHVAERKVVVYEGQHGKKIVLLKRVSLASTMLTIPLIAATFVVETDVIPVAAQMALIGTVAFATFSSTTMLHFVTSPYILRLSEVLQLSEKRTDREFEAVTCGILGNEKRHTFLLSQTQRPSPHPFASFFIKGGKHFYVYGGGLKDAQLQASLTKEGVSTTAVEEKRKGE